MVRVHAVLLLCCLIISHLPAQDIADEFYQELDVQRQPVFDIGGLKVNQQIHYQVLSYFTVYEPDDRGERKVVQEIRDARVVSCDTLSKMIFPQAMNDLKGEELSFTFDRHWDVVRFEGLDEKPQVDRVPLGAGTGLFVTKVIDDDGWKELAKFTLFQPSKNVGPNDPFKYMTRHDWGSLGSWYGETSVKPGKRQRTLRRYAFVHQLEYIPPGDGQQGELPFDVAGAEFQTYRADGEIYYDQRDGRVSHATEWFTARGSVDTEMLGSEVTVRIEEQQKMSIRLKSKTFRVR